MLSSQTAVAGLTPARLKLILGESNIENLTLPDGLPESLDDLPSKIKTTFRLKGNLNLQYMGQAPTDAFPAKKMRPKQAEVNFYPSFLTGKTLESLEKDRLQQKTDRDKEKLKSHRRQTHLHVSLQTTGGGKP